MFVSPWSNQFTWTNPLLTNAQTHNEWKKQTIPVQSTLIILLMKINVQPCRINKFIFCHFPTNDLHVTTKNKNEKKCSKRTNTKSSEIGFGIFIILEHIASPHIPSPFSSFYFLHSHLKKSAFRLLDTLHDTTHRTYTMYSYIDRLVMMLYNMVAY